MLFASGLPRRGQRHHSRNLESPRKPDKPVPAAAPVQTHASDFCLPHDAPCGRQSGHSRSSSAVWWLGAFSGLAGVGCGARSGLTLEDVLLHEGGNVFVSFARRQSRRSSRDPRTPPTSPCAGPTARITTAEQTMGVVGTCLQGVCVARVFTAPAARALCDPNSCGGCCSTGRCVAGNGIH